MELLGWIVAAVALGLWWGERGRRLDAQRREGVIRVDRPRPAVVTQLAEHAPALVPEEGEEGGDLSLAKERYIEDAVAEGYSPRAAEEDWNAMLRDAGAAHIGRAGPV